MLRGEKLMSTKRKFKRDYIMLEAKDLNFRFKDKVTPKAFAKIEITDEKSVIALYAENLKEEAEEKEKEYDELDDAITSIDDEIYQLDSLIEKKG